MGEKVEYNFWKLTLLYYVRSKELIYFRWSSLREKSEAKREELVAAHGVQIFHIECRETVTWIEDKMRVLEQTDELKMDLTGIMTLQRKLSGQNFGKLKKVREKNGKLCQYEYLTCLIIK